MECTRDRLAFAFDAFTRCQRPVGITRGVYPGGYKSLNHRHDFPQIWYCHCGSYKHRVDGVEYDCSEGSVVVVPIGADHQFWCEQEVDVIFLNISYDLLNDIPAQQYKNLRINLFLPAYFEKLELTFSPYRMLCPQSRALAEETFSWLFLQEHTPHGAKNVEQTLSVLETFFSVPEYEISKTTYKKAIDVIENHLNPILKIFDFLNTHYPAKITDEALLKHANLSRAVMYRHFKHIMKCTYYQYLQNLRAKHAHCLLRDTVYSNAKIAALCGFCSTYHMIQNYSRYLGSEIKNQRLHFERLRQNQNESEYR